VDPQLAAVLTGLAAVLVGLAQVIRELRSYHRAVNSRMDELLELTKTSSRAEGRLERPASNVGKSPTELIGDSPPSTRVRRGHN
jgi:hypothetical protein